MKIIRHFPSSQRAWIGILGFLLILAPYVVSDFQRYILTEIFMWGLFAVGFDIIFGKAGLLNFGMGSFFGLGSYAFVWVVHHLGGNI
jgi:branched-chain amino acid transport system permease protein